ncbi:MAG TPA: DUF1223 domain-containing protein [Thermoanaerobaculia bacterium]|nr:DUF1223 domain-containing protein [Thermoanaerobaculia bacterium]
MRPFPPSVALALILPFALLAQGGSASADPGQKKPGGPVVLELFTSQGCSSCPPADRLLSKLERNPRLAGKVIPLSFHVDYWNYIGWTDPFSSPRWSERQRAYGRAFRSNRIYTPQLVVNGQSECVGSNEAEVMRRVGRALAAEPAGRVNLSVQPAGNDGQLRLQVEALIARASKKEGNLDLWVAIYETGLTTPVGSGENASRTLKNDYVVRRLEKAFTLPAAAGSRRSETVTLGLDKRWKRQNLGVAAFLQDPSTLAIQGAAATEL